MAFGLAVSEYWPIALEWSPVMSSLYRALSLYGGPVVLTTAGVIGMALVDPSPAASVGVEQVLAPLMRAVFFGACGATIIGALWGAMGRLECVSGVPLGSG